MSPRSAAWWALAVLLAAGSVWVLADAVADLLGRPAFDAVLRLVIEAIAAAVVVGICVRRARQGHGPRSAE